MQNVPRQFSLKAVFAAMTGIAVTLAAMQYEPLRKVAALALLLLSWVLYMLAWIATGHVLGWIASEAERRVNRRRPRQPRS
ncbi:MAG TPA: hypothetical protein VMV10_03630 [Pirellulales bacterium]|nr:hypothetical protein [Pirellulales bacterium]